MAAKEEEVIYNIVEDGFSENVKGHIGKESEEKLKNDSNTSTSEDDWVEVKVPDNGSLQKRSDASIGRSIQVFWLTLLLFTISIQAFSCCLFNISLSSSFSFIHGLHVFVFFLTFFFLV